MNKHVIEAQTQTLDGRPVRESRSEHTYAALPNDANLIGNVLGGRIMHLVDLCGALAAERHSRRFVATAAVDHLSFLHPVHTGQFLILKSSVKQGLQHVDGSRRKGLERGSAKQGDPPHIVGVPYICRA